MNNQNSEIDGLFKKKSERPVLPIAPAPDAEIYNKFPKKGIAIIFNHKTFDIEQCSPRSGTEKDRDDLATILMELKFDVTIYNDLIVDEVMEALLKVSKMDHTEHECLVVAVMSHGDDGIIFARNQPYRTRKLWTYFSPIHCPSLAGKPKLFFIQACRGSKFDPGFEVTYTDKADSPRVYSIPVMADILVMYATAEGYFAWRQPDEGSYFIQSLVRQLRKHYKSKDLLAILTRVNRDVAVNFAAKGTNKDEYNMKEMCTIVSMLTRDYYFCQNIRY